MRDQKRPDCMRFQFHLDSDHSEPKFYHQFWNSENARKLGKKSEPWIQTLVKTNLTCLVRMCIYYKFHTQYNIQRWSFRWKDKVLGTQKFFLIHPTTVLRFLHGFHCRTKWTILFMFYRHRQWLSRHTNEACTVWILCEQNCATSKRTNKIFETETHTAHTQQNNKGKYIIRQLREF